MKINKNLKEQSSLFTKLELFYNEYHGYLKIKYKNKNQNK